MFLLVNSTGQMYLDSIMFLLYVNLDLIMVLFLSQFLKVNF